MVAAISTVLCSVPSVILRGDYDGPCNYTCQSKWWMVNIQVEHMKRKARSFVSLCCYSVPHDTTEFNDATFLHNFPSKDAMYAQL